MERLTSFGASRFALVKFVFVLTSAQVRVQLGDQREMFDEKCKHLRWFVLPSESYNILSGSGSSSGQVKPPFTPITYPREAPVARRMATERSTPLPFDKSKHTLTESNSRQVFKEGLISTLSAGFDKNQTGDATSFENRTDHAENGDGTSSVSATEKLASAPVKRPHENEHKERTEDDSKVVKLPSSNCHLSKDTEQFCSDSGENHDKAHHPEDKRRKFVCENNVCFVPRKPDNSKQEIAASAVKYKWHCPPKHIFKPITQVSLPLQWALPYSPVHNTYVPKIQCQKLGCVLHVYRADISREAR